MRPTPPSSMYLAGLLVRAAEERVRRAADGEALRLGDAGEILALLQGQHQRLFRIGMLAGFENAFGDGIMRIRDGEVDDHVDLVIGEKLVDGLGADIVFRSPCLGRFRIEVGAGAHFQPLEQRRKAEIGGGDIAASDDADSECLGHGMALLSRILRTGWSAWRSDADRSDCRVR